MNVIPVCSYHDPAFPTRDVLYAHPELLRLAPNRWRHHRLVLTALAATGLLSGMQQAWAVGESVSPAPRIAPIFQHGDGNGSFGCIVVNPPVFLSEEEARQVITEEAKRLGLTFTSDSPTLEGVQVPITDRYAFDDGPARWRKTTLVLDGEDARHKVAYEFVSEQDLDAWETRFHGIVSTVSHYNLLGTAILLGQGLAKSEPEPRVGIFYEPGIGTGSLPEVILLREIPLAPLRPIAGWLGAALKVDKGTITVTRGASTAIFTFNSAQARMNDKTVALSSLVTVRKGVAFVPIRELVEALDAGEGFSSDQWQVTLRHPDSGEALHLPVTLAIGQDGQETAIREQIDQALLHESVRTLSHEELRMQVRDFVTWLKAQGVL